jgi:phosphoribosylformylglycinamidine cyclo-ligase
MEEGKALDNEIEQGLTYKGAGVDTHEGERAVSLMKEHVKKTFNANVLTGLGSFGSLYSLDLKGIDEPVLVAGSDGVGTKLLLAFMMDKHDTVGQDLVAMCANDVLCQGAKPLFFQDYIATGSVLAEKISEIVKGVADGCVLAGCALVGGETAEMPGLYSPGEYDMAGFCVGIVDKSRIIDGSKIRKGDVLIGLASSGLHSNGFSLARKVFFEKAGYKATDMISGIKGSIGEALLTPTRIYTKQAFALIDGVEVKGLVHITGGGFYENIPRVLPSGLGVKIDKSAWVVPPVFEKMMELGKIEEREMFSTFNMGIGLIAIVAKEEVEKAVLALSACDEEAFILGEIVSGGGVEI